MDDSSYMATDTPPFNPLQTIQQGIDLNQQAVQQEQQPNPFQAAEYPPNPPLSGPLNNPAYNAALTPEQQAQYQNAAAVQNGAYVQQAGGPADVAAAMQNMEKQVGTVEPAYVTDKSFATPPQKPNQKVGPSAESDYASQLKNSFDMQEKGVKAISSAAALKATALQEELDAQNSVADVRAQYLEDLQSKSAAAAEAQTKKLEGIANDISSFKFSEGKIDPNNFWNSKSTGDKVMAGIAIALGSLGQGHLAQAGIKSDNAAMTIINNAIENDIKAQKENLAMTLDREKSKVSNMKAGAEINQNLLSEVHKQFGDSLQAEQAARYLMTDMAERRVKSVLAKFDGEEIQAKGQVLLGELGQKKAAAMYDVQKIEAQKTLMQNLYSEGNFRNLTPAQVSQLPPEIKERFVNGYGPAPTKEDATEFKKILIKFRPGVDAVTDAISFAKTYNKLDPKQRVDMEGKAVGLIGPLKDALGLGVLSNPDMALVQSVIGNPNKIFSLRNWEIKKLEGVRDILNRPINAAVQTYGLTAQPKNDSLSYKPYKP